MSWKFPTRVCLLLAGGLAVWGCGPSTFRGADEEKEPQFLIGRSRVNARDFRGAVEAFEQALEANPRSAAAHLELGWLYANKEHSPATAIYHYEKFLQLRPDAENAETIRLHISGLKQELARGLTPIPASAEMQRQLEQLAEENRQLREQLERLRTDPGTASRGNLPGTIPLPAQAGQSVQPNAATRQNPITPPPSRSARAVTTTRKHRVQAGETPAAIARRYNVKLDNLLAANPGLNPKRLRVGQDLTIPGR